LTALWKGVAGGKIATIGSDHCSFNLHGQKDLGRDDFAKIPNGAPGAENRFGLLYSYGVAAGRITLNQFVALVSTNAARLFGLFPRKGTIAVGSDADLVVWDPAVRSVISAATHAQRVDSNPYEGFCQTGQARHVFLRGRPIVANGAFIGDRTGLYLRRDPYFAHSGSPANAGSASAGAKTGGGPCSDFS
jgi:dihydropyrimidinase